MDDIQLSVVLPVHNERANLEPLLGEMSRVLDGLGQSFEIIAVDDGSSDGSLELLEELVAVYPYLGVISLRRNYGQTAALDAGFRVARGAVVVTLDSDGQNDPHDIPALLAGLADGADVVAGRRRERRDPLLRRRLPSFFANLLISRLLGIDVHDLGCTLRSYKREVVAQLHLDGGLHRFILPLAVVAGAQVVEIDVNHRRRWSGRTSYGSSRVFPVLRDLIRVWRWSREPRSYLERRVVPAYTIERTIGLG